MLKRYADILSAIDTALIDSRRRLFLSSRRVMSEERQGFAKKDKAEENVRRREKMKVNEECDLLRSCRW